VFAAPGQLCVLSGPERGRTIPLVEVKILELKADGHGILKIGRKFGIGTSVVQRVFTQTPRLS
jgi:hypothetical protein